MTATEAEQLYILWIKFHSIVSEELCGHYKALRLVQSTIAYS